MMSSQSPWDLLRTGPDDFDPGPRSWAKVEGRLRQAYTSHRRRPKATRRRPSRRTILVGGAALAAGMAAAIAVPLALPSGSPGAPPSAAAVAVLHEAANAAEQQLSSEPIAPGRFLYLKTYEGNAGGSIYPIRGGSPAPESGAPALPGFTTLVRQVWVAADGSGRERVTPGDPSAPTSDTRVPAGTFTTTIVYTDQLPLDPDALRSAIVQRFEGGKANNAATLQFAGTFLQPDAAPQLRAALYRMIATLPGVVSLGPKTDVLGRAGVGVSISEHGNRTQLIFDPESSAVLQEQLVGSDGHVSHYLAYSTSGIVNSAKTIPTN